MSALILQPHLPTDDRLGIVYIVYIVVSSVTYHIGSSSPTLTLVTAIEVRQSPLLVIQSA